MASYCNLIGVLYIFSVVMFNFATSNHILCSGFKGSAQTQQKHSLKNGSFLIKKKKTMSAKGCFENTYK